MPVCPAAEVIKGATDGDSGVICRIMRNEDAASDGITEGAGTGVFLSLRSDPTTILSLCTGDGERKLVERRRPSGLVVRETVHRHFSSCPIFQAEEKRIEERRERAFEPLERPSVEPDPELVERGILRAETAPASIDELVGKQRGEA